MPTASRLIAALFMAGTGLILALELRGLRDSLRFYPYFIEYNALIGALIGWKMVGPRVGFGWARAAATGISAGFVTMMVVVFSLALREMLTRAFRKFYDHALEALLAAVKIGITDLLAVSASTMILPVLMGAVLSGLGAEAADRRWR